LLASGPEPIPFVFSEERVTLPRPLPDFATRRGFWVGCVDEIACPGVVGFKPGLAAGVETADLARKFFVTDTDLKGACFFTTEFDRKCPAGLSFPGSTLPGRLMSVSEPPLASPRAWCAKVSSGAECSAESPLTCASLVAGAGGASGCGLLAPAESVATASAPVLSDVCVSPAGGPSVLVAFVDLVSEGGGLAFRGAECASPSPAGVLVDVAVSSMGDGPPIDCASFTTSWVICSAITILITIVR
jgi:hypothetical protein